MALDPSKVTNDLSATNDRWAEAVKFFTGYPMPARDGLFDTLVGNEGIPLMKVEISDMNQVDYVDTEDYNWLLENAGYKINNTDFVIPFYSASGGDGVDGVVPQGTYHAARGPQREGRQADRRCDLRAGSSAATSAAIWGWTGSPPGTPRH